MGKEYFGVWGIMSNAGDDIAIQKEKDRLGADFALKSNSCLPIDKQLEMEIGRLFGEGGHLENKG